jgi:hypothetical protein
VWFSNSLAMQSSRQIQSEDPASASELAHSLHSSESVSTVSYPRWASSRKTLDLPVPDMPVTRTLHMAGTLPSPSTTPGPAGAADHASGFRFTVC